MRGMRGGTRGGVNTCFSCVISLIQRDAAADCHPAHTLRARPELRVWGGPPGPPKHTRNARERRVILKNPACRCRTSLSLKHLVSSTGLQPPHELDIEAISSLLTSSPFTPTMALNFSLPDAWAEVDPLITLEDVANYLPCLSPAAITRQRMNETIQDLANAYIATDGNATYEDIASVLQITTDGVAAISAILGGDLEMQQLTLWSSRFMHEAPTYDVNIGIFVMVCVFSFVSGITTGLRVYSRWRCHNKGVTAADYLVIAAFLATLLMTANFGNGKCSTVVFKPQSEYWANRICESDIVLLCTYYSLGLGSMMCLFHTDCLPVL